MSAHQEPRLSPDTAAVISAWRPRGVSAEAGTFARMVVAATGVGSPARLRSLLWVTSRLGAWGGSVGLEATPAVLLHPSVIERYVMVGMAALGEPTRRTARTNLRFVAQRVVPEICHPPLPASLRRNQAKTPYSPSEVAAWLALAAAQPSAARRHCFGALLCLGLGAGLEGAELRAVRGIDIVARSGGVLVVVGGRRARVVPVAAPYHQVLVASASFAAEAFVCGGASPTRKNLTTPLVSRVCAGSDLGRLDVGRLRSTWLATHLEDLGLAALFAAAGVVCSQRIGDLARQLQVPDEATLVSVLGGPR